MRRTVAIASAANPRLKVWRKSVAGQVRKTGRTLVAGRRVVADVVDRVGDGAWILPEEWAEPLPGPPDWPAYTLSTSLFAELDIFGTGAPLLDVPIPTIRPLDGPLDGLQVVIPTQDPRNVGAIIRSATGLGASGVILLPSAAHPGHPLTVRTSVGSVFAIPLRTVQSPGQLASLDSPLVALDASGPPITKVALPRRMALLVGLEGPGLADIGTLREQRGWQLVSLPMAEIESYNAGVAASLAMYEWVRQHAGLEEEA